MKHPLLVFLAGLLIGGFVAVWWFVWRDDGERLPDDKRTAMILLEETQSGPGYFHPADPAAAPDEQGVFWLTPAQAIDQIDRVMRERKLDESEREKLSKLINETCEPHPSRTIGGDRIRVTRLNVALDAMK
jgi:K+-transporting ATPase ATPase C chain